MDERGPLLLLFAFQWLLQSTMVKIKGKGRTFLWASVCVCVMSFPALFEEMKNGYFDFSIRCF